MITDEMDFSYKSELLNIYLNSAMFSSSDRNYKSDAIIVLGYKGKKDNVRACLYEGAILKKNRRYAIFTDTEFYGQTASGCLICGKYSEIESVDAAGIVKIYGKSPVPISKKLAKQLKGIDIINHLDSQEDLALAKYVLSFEKAFFGEYMPEGYIERISRIRTRNSLGLYGLHKWILYNLKIKTLTCTMVEFEIHLDDKDLQKGSFSEWEGAVDEFINNQKVIIAFQNLLYRTLCVKYQPENIKFYLNGKVRTTLTTRVENAIDVATSVSAKAKEIADVCMDQAIKNYDKAIKTCESQIKTRELQVENAYRQGLIDEAIVKSERDKIACAKASLQSKSNKITVKDSSASEKSDIKRVKYQQGTVGVAFVFSCPGQKEELAGRVCAGKTGENLEILVEYLNHKRPDIFPSSSRESYTITNASERVHYMALTNDSEASYEEISEPENIQRLSSELSSCRVVVCMGVRATYAVSKACISATVLRGEHLGHQNLNRNYEVDGETSYGRNKQRVEIIGDKILRQI